MKVSLFKKINIFLKVNEQTIDSYFNPHDPAPIYKRQLSHEFEQYIMNYSITIKRYSNVTYKLILENNSDKSFTDPLIHAIQETFLSQENHRRSRIQENTNGAVTSYW